jgi:hypothetical protein
MTESCFGKTGTITFAVAGPMPLSNWTLLIKTEARESWSGTFHLPQKIVPTVFDEGEATIECMDTPRHDMLVLPHFR